MIAAVDDHRYEILKILGQGASADVYLARHKSLNELRVLKILHQEMMVDPRSHAKFRLEAQLAANLKHPAIVRIHDVTQTASTLQIEMEFIEGMSLRQHLEKRKVFPLPVAIAIVAGILEGLAHAHAARLEFDGVVYDGVIHRDLKPENILIRENGQPVICDFGVAKLGADLRSQTAQVSGSVAYMAPERLRGELSTRSIDVFALGIIFFELVKGFRPFQGQGRMDLIESILNWRLVDIAAEFAGMDGSAGQIIAKALARQPSERYADAAEMAAALKPVYKLYHGDTPPADVVDSFLKRGHLTTAQFQALLPEEGVYRNRAVLAALLLLTAAALVLALRFSARPVGAAAESPASNWAEYDALLSARSWDEARGVAAELDSLKRREAYYRLALALFDAGENARALLTLEKALDMGYHPTAGALKVEILLNERALNLAAIELKRVEPWLPKLNPENQARYHGLKIELAELRRIRPKAAPEPGAGTGANEPAKRYISPNRPEAGTAGGRVDFRPPRE